MKKKVCVIGGGSWGTALVKILTENGHKVHWWVRRQETAEYIRKHKHNPEYLSSVQLQADRMTIGTHLQELAGSADILLFALPSSFLDDALSGTDGNLAKGKICISAVKGMIPRFNCLVSDYLKEQLGASAENIVGLGGPCHAEEVAAEKQSYLTFACLDEAVLEQVASMFRCRYIQTNSCKDIEGFEYAAVVKNVYAIAAGICHGVGYGDNFQAVLVSNAMREMHAFIQQVAPRERNVMDTAYLGDLLVTAYSQHSRNRTFGNMIGHGYSVQSAQLEMNMIAEGYYAVKPLYIMLETHSQHAPILETTYRILYDAAPAKPEIHKLSKTFV